MTVGRLAAKGKPFSSEKAKKCLTFFRSTTNVHFHQALVAQLDRATGYEPVGREFESLRAHHSRAKAYEITHKPFFLPFFRAPLRSVLFPQSLRPLSAASSGCRKRSDHSSCFSELPFSRQGCLSPWFGKRHAAALHAAPPGSVPPSACISSMADAGAFDSPAPSEQLRSPRPVARGQEKPFDRTAHGGSKPLAPHPFSIVHAQRLFCGPCMKAAAKERRQQSPEKAEVTSVRGFFL